VKEAPVSKPAVRTTKKAADATETKPAKKAAAPKAKTAAVKAEAKPKAAAAKKTMAKPPMVSPEELQHWIATAAYHRAEKRGFAPGHEAQDWLDAETEVKAMIGHA